MKLEKGKIYVTLDGRKMIPSPVEHSDPNYTYLLDTSDNNWLWTYKTSNGRLAVREHDPLWKQHIVSEWIDPDKPQEDVKASKPIDKLNYLDFRKGIDAMWDTYRI